MDFFCCSLTNLFIHRNGSGWDLILHSRWIAHISPLKSHLQISKRRHFHLPSHRLKNPVSVLWAWGGRRNESEKKQIQATKEEQKKKLLRVVNNGSSVRSLHGGSRCSFLRPGWHLLVRRPLKWYWRLILVDNRWSIYFTFQISWREIS